MQIDSPLRHDIFLRLLPFLPEGFSEYKLLGLIRVPGSAALRAAGTAAAIFIAVSGGGFKLSVPHLSAPPTQMQFLALCAGEAVFLWIIFHMLECCESRVPECR